MQIEFESDYGDSTIYLAPVEDEDSPEKIAVWIDQPEVNGTATCHTTLTKLEEAVAAYRILSGVGY